ncbi:MAG: YkgJ family cysteine cluster protein [Lachnospiraceae bacterium]
MIVPRKVKFEAKKKENENLEFRTFLKCHADETELDKQFKRLHDELFSNYDCSRCRNCCKMYYGSIPSEDLERDAEFLDLTKEQFVERYLIKKEEEDTYETNNNPCDFMQEDGNCKLGECRPESCKKYPYTDQPDRLQSLYSVLNAVEVCPVAFEIYERLKKEYGFRFR